MMLCGVMIFIETTQGNWENDVFKKSKNCNWLNNKKNDVPNLQKILHGLIILAE